MICCRSQVCWIDHPLFWFLHDQDLHWRRQRRDGAIILTDKRLIHVATLDPGYPEKDVFLVVRLEKATSSSQYDELERQILNFSCYLPYSWKF